MEGEREREGDQADRIMKELEELIDSPSEPAGCAPAAAVGTSRYSFHASFQNRLQLSDETSNMINTNQSTEGLRLDTNYREKLRSYVQSGFQASTSLPSSAAGTSSRCTNTDMMEIVSERSLRDGDGSDYRRQPRPQGRQRRESAQSSKSAGVTTTSARGPSRRSSGYLCDVCGEILPSPQSLGGHKNRHRPSRGKNQRPSRASSAPIVDQMVGDQAGSGSNSSESDSVPTLYKGVRCREGNKWVTEIRPPKSKEKWWLGTFPSAEEAAQVYDVALAYFKSESELNFGYHPLYQKFHQLPPGDEFAQRLRDMVKDISDQIIAERRSESEQAAANSESPLGRRQLTASPAGSSTSTDAAPSSPQTVDPPVLAPDFVESPPSPPPTPFVWTDLLNLPSP